MHPVANKPLDSKRPCLNVQVVGCVKQNPGTGSLEGGRSATGTVSQRHVRSSRLYAYPPGLCIVSQISLVLYVRLEKGRLRLPQIQATVLDMSTTLLLNNQQSS